MDNFNQIDQQLSAWIDAHADELIQKTQQLLQVPSVKGEPAEGAPFGLETCRALDLALSFAGQYGLTTKNLDGYAGHAEWVGESVAAGAPIVEVLAHVDVVPAGDDWKHPPFGAEIAEGRIVARGVIDDKGPAMAGLYALLALKECSVPVTKRFRLILGADEESGFGCVAHYFQHEEMPATGFTPDAEFPLIYAEKGIANAVLTRPAPSEGEHIHLYSLRGGLRPNMVPDFAEAILKNNGGSNIATQARLNSVIGIHAELIEDGARVRVTAKGVSAHGSRPEKGINALVVLCDALLLLDHQEDQVEMIQHIYNWGSDTTGGALGIAGQDDIAGPLTSNLGIAELAEEQLTLTFNIRYPVTWNEEVLRQKLQKVQDETQFTLQSLSNQAPLYVPKDDPLVATLWDVYRADTGDETTPLMTMGGGTYARAMTKGVAFGPAFPGEPDQAHQADKSWAIDHLLRAAKIYAKALARLGNQ